MEEEMQLDLNAPILSVRRIASKNDQHMKMTTGSPGVVPFVWEQSPGRPKGSESDCMKIKEKKEDGDDDDDGFKDAVDMISFTSGSYSDCSVSGNSSSSGDLGRQESFSKDPEVREFMMGRFLPAAKAMTTGPLETAHQRQKESQSSTQRRTAVSLPYQHTPKTISKFPYDKEDGESFAAADDDDNDDEEEEGYGGVNSHFSRSCGVIPRFCLKSSFLLFNPVTGMKVRRNLPPPRSRFKVSDHGSSPAQSDYESWEAVYRHKYKVGLKDNPALKDDASKLTSESNLLTFWSDSQTADESSYQDSPRSPSRERASCDHRQYESSSMIPSIDRTVSFDSYTMVETLSSRSKTAEPVEYGVSSFLKGNTCNDHVQLNSKVEEIGKKDTTSALSLLPPPLPTSPSESWLQRTLPSGSSRTPPPHSLLNVQHRRRV